MKRIVNILLRPGLTVVFLLLFFASGTAVVSTDLVSRTFTFDSRSSFIDYRPAFDYIPQLRGEFTNWATNPILLTDEDRDGVWETTVSLAPGDYNYKFYYYDPVNSANNIDQNYIADPDNPAINYSDHNNSIATVTLDTLPRITAITPGDGEIISSGETISFRIGYGLSDRGYTVVSDNISIELDGSPVSFTVDTTSKEISGTLDPPAAGDHNFTVTVIDSSGAEKTGYISFGVYGDSSGFHSIDHLYDDTGGGSLNYPAGVTDGSADIVSFGIEANETADSLQFTVKMRDLNEHSLVYLDIMNRLVNSYAEAGGDTEIDIPDFSSDGIQFKLLPADSPYFSAGTHNALLYGVSDSIGQSVSFSEDPVQNDFYRFTISIADLEQYLGSFSTWYFMLYSFLPGSSDAVFEPGSTEGGIAGTAEPDVYDAAFIDSRSLQNRLLSNYITFSGDDNSRSARLDNTGRGIKAISSSEISDNLATSEITSRVLTPSGTVLDAEFTAYFEISTLDLDSVFVELNGVDSLVQPDSSVFSKSVTLVEGQNSIRLHLKSGAENSLYSNTSILTLEKDHDPVAVIGNVTGAGDNVLVFGSSSDPDGDAVSYLWESDPGNPETIVFTNANQRDTSFPKPETDGEYYFTFTVTDPDGNRDYARSFITMKNGIVMTSWINSNAAWVRNAVVYEIFVRSFSPEGTLAGVTARLDSIADLGVNCIWFMPIHEGPTDHGYAIKDYFDIEVDYGTKSDFQTLVNEAHDRGIRVILDNVSNHTHIDHPHMADIRLNGQYSHFYDFYERRRIGGDNGLGQFISSDGLYSYYSNWYSLPNVNLSSRSAENFFLDVARYWIEEFDVDGYRCDVAWGPMNRYGGGFWTEFRRTIKKIKPDAFLLAEASSNDHTFFDSRFDSAYDWDFYGAVKGIYPGSQGTILNQITNEGFYYPDNAFPFRFIENHDEDRYIQSYGLDKAKVAAALILTIPGIPLIYAGQEVGETSQRGTIDWSDPHGLRSYYKKLVSTRTSYPVFSSDEIQQVTSSSGNNLFAYIRTSNDSENTGLVTLNFSDENLNSTVYIPDLGLEAGVNYFANEFTGNTSISVTAASLDSFQVSLAPYESKVWLISKQKITSITEDESEPDAVIPEEFNLNQNYPNPFNGSTNIRFSIRETSQVKLEIYSVTGRLVATLNNGLLSPGNYIRIWNGKSDSGRTVSSGIYLCSLRAGPYKKTIKLAYVR